MDFCTKLIFLSDLFKLIFLSILYSGPHYVAAAPICRLVTAGMPQADVAIRDFKTVSEYSFSSSSTRPASSASWATFATSQNNGRVSKPRPTFVPPLPINNVKK